MIPGMNPRKMQQMMKKMGIAQQDLGALKVVITLEDKTLVFTQPSVQKVNMMGQQTFQITGDYQEQSLDSIPDINDEDIATIKAQVEADETVIRETLTKNKGDIAQTILDLQ
jgi:nascent polypeptide-associated complex subunit alpha